MADAEKRLFTPKEVAAALSVSTITVFRMIADGRIPSVKIGHSRRISAETLNTIVQQGA